MTKTRANNDVLLRLHLLRQISFLMHAEQSRLLATGHEKMARIFAKDEEQVEALRSQFSKKKPNAALLAALGRERLTRPDRKWESALAVEAQALGWNFWVLKTTILIPSPSRHQSAGAKGALEVWQDALEELLWPGGVLLWTETEAGSPLVHTEEGLRWTGAWWIVLEPTQEATQLAIPSLPGWQKGSPIVWERILGEPL